MPLRHRVSQILTRDGEVRNLRNDVSACPLVTLSASAVGEWIDPGVVS